MAIKVGFQKVEKLIFMNRSNVYELFAGETSQTVLFSYVFQLDKKKEIAEVKTDFMIRNGISVTEKPVDRFIDLILKSVQ